MQFKSAMKRVLLRASLTASRYANCLSFDPDTSPPIFSLKYTKNRSALVQEDAGDSVDLDLSLLDNPLVMSEPLMGTLAYIGGCLVRSLSKEIDCQTCCAALLTKDKRMHHLSLICTWFVHRSIDWSNREGPRWGFEPMRTRGWQLPIVRYEAYKKSIGYVGGWQGR